MASYAAATIQPAAHSNNATNTNATANLLARAILPDLPLLMHGSGDARPEYVNPTSVSVLGQMIEQYVTSLVGAAMDAHDVFTDGEVVGGGACLGVPPFNSSGGANDEESESENDEEDLNSTYPSKKRKSTTDQERVVKHKKQQKVDYWDEPLPPPGADNNDDDLDSSNDPYQSESSDDSDDDDAPLIAAAPRCTSSSSSISVIEQTTHSHRNGIVPIDLHSTQRTRNYYVTAPTALDARAFIFPVCHDAVLYQRIKEVQASRRTIRREVLDNSCLMQIMREGENIGRMGVVDMMDAVLGDDLAGIGKGSDKDNDGKESDNPVARDTSKTNTDKKDESAEVGAGLVDPANVNPSWPGMRLW